MTPNSVLGGFGRVAKYLVDGKVFAQPVGLANITSSPPSGCGAPCDLVFIATEKDMLYAFDDNSATPLWSLDLAGQVGGTYADCATLNIPPCEPGVIAPHLGVTGTPVIDRSAGILYVAAIVHLPISPNDVAYFLYGVDYRAGKLLNSTVFQIDPVYPGVDPPSRCGTALPPGQIALDASTHFQRAGLLLLPVNGSNEVFVAFAQAANEDDNGWLLGYRFDQTHDTFTQFSSFVTTAYGTGGGIWMAGAGPASDGNYIYVSAANGTFDVKGVSTLSTDYGESMLKRNLSDLSEADYFTPSDANSYVGVNGLGRCINDLDLGSGGLLLFPNSFLNGHPHLMIGADKESILYLVDRDHLSGFNASGDQIVQEVTTPTPVEPYQGYWGSPAYWEYLSGGATTRIIYYSVDATTESLQHSQLSNYPRPIYGYALNPTGTPGPIPQVTTLSTTTAFCGHGGAPTISANANSAGTGILWAVEAHNSDNIPPLPTCKGFFGPAALHAYDAASLTELYNSYSFVSSIGSPVPFETPMVFNGKVYVGAFTGSGDSIQGEVDVFGLCTTNCKN